MNTIKECFDIILKGGKEESRKAAREVRKLLYSSKSGKDDFKDIKKIIYSAPQEYAKISEYSRQENFVVAVSVIYYLHDKEKQPDFLFSWLFYLLQHQNGNIRHAAVRMFENELGSLTYHIRFPNEKLNRFRELLPEQADSILRFLFINLNELFGILWQPKYKKYKYIDSLPASPYKSAQMVLARMEEMCGKKYMDSLAYLIKPL